MMEKLSHILEYITRFISGGNGRCSRFDRAANQLEMALTAREKSDA